jgi:2-polyprenyl-3-methyl-5-hydroxy-6-metoxy-1,4-benzoquinol methylase
MMDNGVIEGDGFFRQLDAVYKQPGQLMRQKMKLVKSVVRSGQRLLDIGCGTGEALVRLRDCFKHIVGLDASASAVEYAWRKVGNGTSHGLIQGSAFRLCFQGGAFDCCLLLDVLEHLEHPHLVLSQVSYVLREGGQLIVTVPNWTNWVTARLLGLNLEHRTFHTPRGWKQLLTDSGFRVHSYRAVRLPFLGRGFGAKELPYLGMCILLVAERQAKA